MYLGSAYLVDHVDRVNLTEEQQAILAQIADPRLAETTRDMIIGRQFRRDMFVKGSTPLPQPLLREPWLAMRLVLMIPAEDVDLTFDTTLGKLQLRPDVYKPMLEILAKGPATVRELLELLPEPRPGWVSLTDAIKVLIGRGQVQPAPTDGLPDRVAATKAFNSAVLAQANSSRELQIVVAHRAQVCSNIRQRLVELYEVCGQQLQVRRFAEFDERVTDQRKIVARGLEVASDVQEIIRDLQKTISRGRSRVELEKVRSELAEVSAVTFEIRIKLQEQIGEGVRVFRDDFVD
jgi:hypothetical protein